MRISERVRAVLECHCEVHFLWYPVVCIFNGFPFDKLILMFVGFIEIEYTLLPCILEVNKIGELVSSHLSDGKL